MEFWIMMLLAILFVPIIMIICGISFINGGVPKKINYFVGYRTTMSMKNKDTWEFAHKCCGKVWWRVGLILIPLSIIPMLFIQGNDVDTIGGVCGSVCCVQVIILIGTVIFVEAILKRNFDENGERIRK